MRHLAAAVLLSSAFASAAPANAATSYSSLGVGSGGYTYGYFDARSYAGISFTLKNDLAHGEVRQIGLGDLQSLSFYTFYLLRDFPGQYPHAEAMFQYSLADISSFTARVLASTPDALAVLEMNAVSGNVVMQGNARIPFASTTFDQSSYATFDPQGRNFGGGVMFGVPDAPTWALLLTGMLIAGASLRLRLRRRQPYAR